MNQTTLLSRKAKALLRWILTALTVLIGALLAYDGYTIFYNANFRTIVSGEAYRSGQMDAAQLSRVIQEYGIKSIINLRGTTDAPALYQGEMETAKRLGVQHYDFSLSATNEITVSQMDDLIRTLREAPKPVLIHCQAGSDRTGLVSALYCLTLKGETPAQADRKLSVWYGHISLSKTLAMDHSYWHYVSNHLAGADRAIHATVPLNTVQTLNK
jgi:protein tyrosine/serine phosphatase